MKRSISIPTAAAAASFFLTAGSLLAVPAESKQIDRFIEDGLKRERVKPNPASTDEEFLRRIYLDIIGRIPTYSEAKEFLDHEAPDKRSRLIKRLFSSEGYVSHTFNWWADVLRLKTRGDGEVNASGAAYASFVKNAIRENMPYDQFVRELVNPTVVDRKTGERKTGKPVFAWDNGAAGYYMRDSGMPLDNMSNTLQVFMGTRVVCAQCHDHPFDKWSQMDYHQLAAYTYNTVGTRVRPAEVLNLDKRLNRRDRRGDGKYLRDALNDLFEPLNYGVTPTERALKLPHDYRSEKKPAKPHEEVRPSTSGFKDAPKAKGKTLDAYAEWMTSPQNQRFNKVIANRIWKRVYGRGLVEPVDDWKDDTEPSNRYVLDYLTRLLVQSRYDIKGLLEILYNTRTYQRQAFGDDIPEDTHYHFPGPILRRMSAEQLWDSFMTVAVPGIDERMKGYAPRENRYQKEATVLLTLAQEDKNALLKLAESIAEVNKKTEPEIAKFRSQNKRKEIQRVTKERDEKIATLKREAFDGVEGASEMMMENTMMMEEEAKKSDGAQNGNRWAGYDPSFLRASELQSPAPAGHFLRQFGQSDRDTIENSSRQPSVDQALTLLNSSIFDSMFHDKSQLASDMANATSLEEKQDIVFISLLSRYPRDADRELVAKQVERYGEQRAFRNIMWALMNTQEFCFLQ